MQVISKIPAQIVQNSIGKGLKNEGLQVLQQITKVPFDLNAQLAKLKLLHPFAAPPAWAKNAEPTHP